MVFCGKPSKGCGHCRQKRTKCDLARPSCGQCGRTRRVCGGYRNIEKHDVADASLPSKTKPVAYISPSHITNECVTLRDLAHKHNIDDLRFTPVVDQATHYFFQTHVWHQLPTCKGPFDYLPGLWTDAPVQSALAYAVTALGMLGLGKLHKSTSLVLAACSKYSAALRLIKVEICAQDQAQSNQVLATVMVLSLYETYTSSVPRKGHAWSKHIDGAVALLETHDQKALETITGSRIFMYLRTQSILNCLRRNTSVPAVIVRWSQHAQEHVQIHEDLVEAQIRLLSAIAINFCNARAQHSNDHDGSDAMEYVCMLLNIDRTLIHWAEQLPSPFLYHVRKAGQQSEYIYADSFHEYSNARIATTWNHYRSIRILVNEEINIAIPQIDETSHSIRNDFFSEPGMDKSYQLFCHSASIRSQNIVVQLVNDICASVPFFLSDCISVQAGSYVRVPSSRTINGNLLLWPLYVAAATGLVSSSMRI